MKVSITTDNGQTLIALQGRFDFNAHREFRDAVESALAASSREVIVDMAAVEYLDSSALGMLLMLRDKTKSANREVSLRGCSGPVKQVLDIANFGKLFNIG